MPGIVRGNFSLSGGYRVNTLNLRQAIIQRVHDKSTEDLLDIIDDSVGADERTLPGLGVLFELIWQDTPPEGRQQMVDTLHRHLASIPAPLQSAADPSRKK
jgi:small acid-soluble spore protein I (minor)